MTNNNILDDIVKPSLRATCKFITVYYTFSLTALEATISTNLWYFDTIFYMLQHRQNLYGCIKKDGQRYIHFDDLLNPLLHLPILGSSDSAANKDKNMDKSG